MSEKTMAERAAEYMRQRFRAMDVGEILDVDHLAQTWKTLGPGHFAVYIAAEQECERLRAELASVKDEVNRLRALQRDTAVKAEAMHLVLAVMTAKADVSDEKMIGALDQAKAGVEAALVAGEFDPERFGWKEGDTKS